jgi:hypothetical protein
MKIGKPKRSYLVEPLDEPCIQPAPEVPQVEPVDTGGDPREASRDDTDRVSPQP